MNFVSTTGAAAPTLAPESPAMVRAQNARLLAPAILQRNVAESGLYLPGKSNPVGYNFVFILAALQIRLIWMVDVSRTQSERFSSSWERLVKNHDTLAWSRRRILLCSLRSVNMSFRNALYIHIPVHFVNAHSYIRTKHMRT